MFIVTGDHPSTATAIAREIGLMGDSETVILHFYTRPRSSLIQVDKTRGGNRVRVNLTKQMESDCVVVHGRVLFSMTESEWDVLLKYRHIIFARQEEFLFETVEFLPEIQDNTRTETVDCGTMSETGRNCGGDRRWR